MTMHNERHMAAFYASRVRAIRSGPMSFAVDGKQHVAVSGGHALFVFALE